MEIFFDLSAIPTNSPLLLGWWFFKTIGWIYPVFLFVYGLLLYWQFWIRNKYRHDRKYILLAIDVPKDNEQGPKGVENIFNQLAGAHQPLGFLDDWWTGEIKNSFSFEIVSLGGYIQFIIHLVDRYRDLIEAMIYAQYPDAEITEIEDYTKDWNLKFPNNQYQLWGSELKLAKSEFYPIRTYPEFQHVEEGFKDSMASLLEGMTRIGPGEQIWVQIVATPADNSWGDAAEHLIKKLAGGKPKIKKNAFDYIYGAPNLVLAGLNPVETAASVVKKDEPPTQMLYLTQGEKDRINAIERKIGKLGFHCKIRLIYFAEKAKFKKAVPSAVYGAFKQFNTLDLNSLKPDKRILTASIFWLKEFRLNIRRRKILYRYKWRGYWLDPGYEGYILNSEELASIYHFPVITVKAPLVRKTEAKKAEPPMGLPIEQMAPPVKIPSAPKAQPPENLPVG